jgi:ribonuclease Z
VPANAPAANALAGLAEGYSLALYSTWLWLRPYRLLFDAGEGVALRLHNRVFAVRYVLLSHGHLDHISGLPSLLNIRAAGMGDTTHPLTIVHPAGDGHVAAMRRYIEAGAEPLGFPLEWRAVTPGERIEVDELRVVEAFATRHVQGRLTLGYRLLERRHRLRPQWRGLSGEQLRDMAQREGRDAVQEPVDHPLLVYGGDGLMPALEHLAAADVACLEATFLRAEDRGPLIHSTVAETMAAAAAAEVRELLLLHVSGRYQRREIRPAVLKAAAEAGYGGRIHLLWRESLRTLR